MSELSGHGPIPCEFPSCTLCRQHSPEVKAGEEAELQERDERLVTALAKEIRHQEGRIAQARDELRSMEQGLRRLRSDIRDGHWWRLQGIEDVLQDDLDSQCETESDLAEALRAQGVL